MSVELAAWKDLYVNREVAGIDWGGHIYHNFARGHSWEWCRPL